MFIKNNTTIHPLVAQMSQGDVQKKLLFQLNKVAPLIHIYKMCSEFSLRLLPTTAITVIYHITCFTAFITSKQLVCTKIKPFRSKCACLTSTNSQQETKLNHV